MTQNLFIKSTIKENASRGCDWDDSERDKSSKIKMFTYSDSIRPKTEQRRIVDIVNQLTIKCNEMDYQKGESEAKRNDLILFLVVE